MQGTNATQHLGRRDAYPTITDELRRLDEAFFHGPDGCFGAIAGFELAEDVLHVLFDGFDADVERTADFTIG